MEAKGSVGLETLLPGFLHRVKDDVRIGPSHISVFTALVAIYHQRAVQPVEFFGRELMQLAKVSNRTYLGCMRDLHQFRYIKYVPSFNPAAGSLVWFL